MKNQTTIYLVRPIKLDFSAHKSFSGAKSSIAMKFEFLRKLFIM